LADYSIERLMISSNVLSRSKVDNMLDFNYIGTILPLFIYNGMISSSEL